MKQPFMQPFKQITLIVDVKDSTGVNSVGSNDGVIDDSRVGKTTTGTLKYPNGPDGYMLKNDAKYSPVIIHTDGKARLAKDGTVPIIGVLMESFTAPLQPHAILTEGIIWMKAHEAVQAGDLLTAKQTVATSRDTQVKKAAAGEWVFGIALQAAAAGDWLAVLVGTTGGKLA